MATYVGFAASQVAWSGEAPEIFRSSPGVQRSFCRRCGSPMSYASEGSPGEIHLFAASFERPETLAPSVHVFAGEQLPWLQMADGLPRFAKLSKDEPPLV